MTGRCPPLPSCGGRAFRPAFMPETSNKQFGLLIAYVLPGFIALVGLTPLFPAILQWLKPVEGSGGLGPPLYAVLGATTLGLILSCFRWLLIDRVHHWTGIRRPSWNDTRLPDVLGGFDYLVQNHFRYYEFCGNSLLAILSSYGVNRALHTVVFLGAGTDVAMTILAFVLFTASRDALQNYYNRSGRLVGRSADNPLGDSTMFNGNDHGGGNNPTPSQPHPETKPPASGPTPPPPATPGGTGSQK